MSQIRLRTQEALARAARVATAGNANQGGTGTNAQLHTVMRALEEIAELADVDPQLVGLHSTVLGPGARSEPSAFADQPRSPGIMDSLILMVDYCTPTGRHLSSGEGQRVVHDLVTQLVNDLPGVGWVDCIDVGNPRGATVYLVGPDRHRLWHAVEATLEGWPLRSITALLRAADRRQPDTFHEIGFEPEVDRDVPEELVLEVLASMSRALWGVPTPPLRAVTLEITRTGVRGRFIYAEPPSEDEAELVSLCETYLSADFTGVRPQFGVAFSPDYVPVDQDRTLNVGEQWFYLRHEHDQAGVSEH